ncbi:MAG: 2-oxoacid:acceptor oxidoreductase subunit alpha [Thermofilaceae archaeon]|nr:2-oxoacid:acceptor oxidoreductase subunit alpha [Thermofilaceae archaeon]
MDEASCLLGGFQGSGVETSMMVLVKALAHAGYSVLAQREYYSNITGRHSYILMRICSSREARSLSYPVHLIAALDSETVFTHAFELTEGGLLVLDRDLFPRKLREVASMEEQLRERLERRLASLGVGDDIESLVEHLASHAGVKVVAFSYRSILSSVGEKRRIPPTQVNRYLSSIIFSAVASLISLKPLYVEQALRSHFKGREELVANNMAVFEEVSARVREAKASLELEQPKLKWERLLVASGNDAVAMGKVAGGLRFQSYYPITPAADESLFLERLSYDESTESLLGPLLVLQVEDEIAAVASAIGAALAGVRSSTTTSGPGFDLMVEGLSYAGMNEVPIVVTYYQRGGPSTGQPTRGSQSDLFNAIFAGHGEFSRVVISSGDHLEAFYDAAEAFNIAEKYQVPVIHLLDKFLANSVTTMPFPDLDKIKVERGNVVAGGEGYKRFSLEALVPPRAFLGDAIFWHTGDEHDEYGRITEDPENREKMYRRRIEKMQLIRDELPRERKLTVQGSSDSNFLLIGWGSVKGVALDALEALEKEGVRGAYVNLKLLWPFPGEEVKKLLSSAEDVIAIEHSYGALVGKLISMELGVKVEKSVVKYTGRPITFDELQPALKKILSGVEKRVVLKHGA